jgi:hypothetical protein
MYFTVFHLKPFLQAINAKTIITLCNKAESVVIFPENLTAKVKRCYRHDTHITVVSVGAETVEITGHFTCQYLFLCHFVGPQTIPANTHTNIHNHDA